MHAPTPSQSETSYTRSELASYARLLYRRGPMLRRLLQRWRPWICPFGRLIELTPAGSSVLDVGCGGGLFLGLLLRTGRLGSGVGFDVSAEAINLAQAMASDAFRDGDALRFLRLGAQDDWPQGLFDVVSIIDVMHHVPVEAQRELLMRAASHVKPGGRLLYKDMCRRPRWRAAANRLHDALLSRQWIHYAPIASIEEWATQAGFVLDTAKRIDMLWYGHELRVFTKPGSAP